MPVYDVIYIGAVLDIDANLMVFAQTQYRTRYDTVVGEGFDHLTGDDLQPNRRDPQGVVRRVCSLR